MSISLLYCDSVNKAQLQTQNNAVSNALYNLNIDKMAASACVNLKSCEYFLKIISCPLQEKEDILYRREILIDFLQMPSLLPSLSQLLKSFDNLRDETKEMTDGIFKFGSPSSVSDLLDFTYEQLYINAHFIRNVIAYFSELNNCFSKFAVTSKGLLSMKSYCEKMLVDANIEKVEEIAELFKNESAEKYSFSLSAAFSDTLLSNICGICDIKDTATSDKKKILGNIFKKKPEIPLKVNIGSAAADNAVKLLIEAMSELSDMFWDIACGVYEMFYGISDELLFFSAACDIAKFIKTNGMHYTFPTVCDETDNSFCATDLYDLLLINEGKKPHEIVTNSIDFRYPCTGVLVRGDNNCGKTSFLRSIGCAMIFAQSGLFVCAKELKMSKKQALFTHFSSAEKESGDDAGRFEGEVKEIVKIIDEIEPYSLLLLNETFQTTAYKEGALGMKDILSALSEINVFYIFVTHMQTMFDVIEDEKVTKLMTGEGDCKYKLIPFTQ